MTTTGSEKHRLTALLGVNAAGVILPQLLVLKGKKIPRGTLELEDGSMFVTSSQNAWITEKGFLSWIKRIWHPYSSGFNRSLLILDQFKVHKMDSVVEELK